MLASYTMHANNFASKTNVQGRLNEMLHWQEIL